MRFSIITSSLLLAQGTCLAAPPVNTAEGFSPVLRSKLEARDSYDCNGSGLCGAIAVRDCDNAINNRLIRNNDVNYGAPGCGMTIRISDEMVAESAAVSIGEMVA
ncbi:hypothetical protein FACUT_13793 [Fusarium acutatum]|uniref:Ecp2 effector protein domain-containing protein n=1 Tax=Fusarium acutatum TaxID=78861 RepID=A0A8H4J8K5_9HYPO|nr:hypothetical protein FACUT_13793 [Fusarium acutatum]